MVKTMFAGGLILDLSNIPFGIGDDLFMISMAALFISS